MIYGVEINHLVQFPNLFRMARLRDAMVHDVSSWNGTRHHWDISFTKSLNDWEEESIISLLALLADLYADGLPEGDDKIIWSLNSSRIFSVKSLCERMGLIILSSRLRQFGSQKRLQKHVFLFERVQGQGSHRDYA